MRTRILRTGRMCLSAIASGLVVAAQYQVFAKDVDYLALTGGVGFVTEIIDETGEPVDLPERLPNCAGKPAAPSFPVAALPVIEIEENLASSPPVLFLPVRPEDVRGGFSTTAAHSVSPVSLRIRPDSYMKARRYLEAGTMPPDVTFRIDDFLNHAGFDYASPSDSRLPFAVHVEAGKSPWRGSYLLKIGVKAHEAAQRPPVNLVIIDAGSVPARQPRNSTLSRAIIVALGEHRLPGDRVGIRSTTGYRGIGLKDTYESLEAMQMHGAINSVVVLTSGNPRFHDVDQAALADYVADRRRHGLLLSVITVGSWPDAGAEHLAEAGGGVHLVVDSDADARGMSAGALARLAPVALDVTAEVRFNEAVVQSYRPPLYERFSPINAGSIVPVDVAPGLAVTTLYDLDLDPGRPANADIGIVRLRYRLPGERRVRTADFPLPQSILDNVRTPSADMRFAAAIATFGDIVYGSSLAKQYGLARAIALAESGMADDAGGHRAEFIGLLKKAAAIEAVRTGSMTAPGEQDAQSDAASAAVLPGGNGNGGRDDH